MYRKNDGGYRCVIKRRERVKEYQKTAKGAAAKTKGHRDYTERRLFVGSDCVGVAPTKERAAFINQHIRQRVHVFKQGQQARAEVESVSARRVPPEANAGTD